MKKYCITLGYTIKEAIDNIDASKNRVAIVLNEDSKVVGVLSQGDIIRALSSGKSLFSRIDSLIRPNYVYLNSKEMSKAYELFKKLSITLIPVVNDEFQLIDVITLKDIYKYMEEK